MAQPAIQVSVSVASGETFAVTGVQLFPEQWVVEIAQSMAQASAKLGGISTGVGFIGDMGWVLAGAAVLSGVEALLSEKSKKEGVSILAAAEQRRGMLMRSGVIFPLEEVQQISQPHPQRWVGLGKPDGRYIHSGEDFVGLDTPLGLIHVRWNEVVTYQVLGAENIPPEPKQGEPVFKAPEYDLPPLPNREGPFEYRGHPYFMYPDGRVDGATTRGWYRLSSIDEYRDYVDRSVGRRP